MDAGKGGGSLVARQPYRKPVSKHDQLIAGFFVSILRNFGDRCVWHQIKILTTIKKE